MGNTIEVNGTTYVEHDSGFWFHENTPEGVIRAIVDAYNADIRVHIDYGNVTTGQSWGETSDVDGYIGRSTGPVKVPLLIHNRRSRGGAAILDHCVLSIRGSRKGDLYLYRRKEAA